MQVKLLGSGKIMLIVFVLISLYDLILVSTISSASLPRYRYLWKNFFISFFTDSTRIFYTSNLTIILKGVTLNNAHSKATRYTK